MVFLALMSCEKPLPFSGSLFDEIASQYGTPIFVYDEAGISANASRVNEAFSWSEGHTNFFAVKATPTPGILRVIAAEGMGFDCSSRPELRMVGQEGLAKNGVFYSSNNTPSADYSLAESMGAVINVDKYPYVRQVLEALGGLPLRMSIRYNPGDLKIGNNIIGVPGKSKFGDTEQHVLLALRDMQQSGVSEIGLHTMLVSNETRPELFGETAKLLREMVERAGDIGVPISFVNIGGGLGVTYHPEDEPVDVEAIGEAVKSQLGDLEIPVYSENGRYVTGPHGYLLTRVTHGIIDTYQSFVQVDTSINNMARLATVSAAYHHINVLGKDEDPTRPMNVTGSMCANTDIFFKDRELPITIEPDDLMVIQDAGAHCRANSHNYNFRVRAGEVLVHPDGSHSLVRRHETEEDIFATTKGL